MAETIDISLRADTRELINALKELPDVGAREARDMVRALQKEYRAAEKAASKSAKATEGSWTAGLRSIRDTASTIAAPIGVATLALGATGAAALAAGAGYASWANDINGVIDTIGTLEAATGLSAETINGLRLIASQTNKELTELVPKDLAKKILETSQGTGEGLKSFEKYGIAVADTSGELRDADDVFVDIIDVLSRIESPTERAAESVKLLGEEGKNLFSAISDASDLERFVGLAAEFGLDTGPEAVRLSGEWFRAVSTLQTGFEDLQSAVVQEFGDEAIAVLEETSVATVFLSTLVGELEVDVAALGRGVVFLGEVFAPSLVTIGEGLVTVADGALQTEGALARARERAEEFRDAFFGDAAFDQTAALVELGILIEDVNEKFETTAEKSKKAAEAARAHAQAQREAAEEARELAEVQRQAAADADALQRIIDEANRDQLEGLDAINAKYDEQLTLIASVGEASALAAEAEAAVLARRQREIDSFNDQMVEDVRAAQQEMVDEMDTQTDRLLQLAEEALAELDGLVVTSLESIFGDTATLLGMQIDRLRAQAEQQEQEAIEAAESVADASREQADADLDVALARGDLSDEARAIAEADHEAALARIENDLAAQIAAAETLKEDEQQAALVTFQIQQALATSMAIMDAARAAIALIPAFISVSGPYAPLAAAGAAGVALGTQLAIIHSEKPPQFPTGLDPDHRLAGIQPGELIASRRAAADPVVREAVRAGNEGRRMPEPTPAVGVHVSLDPRLQRLRITTDRRMGKRGPRRR